MSCLFDSLSKFVVNMSGGRLRQIIVEYLKTNPLIMDDISFSSMMSWENDEQDSSETYLARMSKDDTWGGAIEIKAFCKLYRCRVDVHIPTIGKIVSFFPDENENNTVCNIMWTGNHFEALGCVN